MNLSSLSNAQISSVLSGMITVVAVGMNASGMIDDHQMLVPIGVAVTCIGSTIYNIYKCRSALAHIESTAKQVAKGDYEARIVLLKDKGEIQGLGQTINELIDRSDSYVRESAAAMEAVANNTYYRKILEAGMVGTFLNGSRKVNAAIAAIEGRVVDFRAVTQKFEQQMNTALGQFSNASQQLAGTAGQMSAAAQSTSERAVNVAAAAEEASTNVQTVASATEELTASIAEIGEGIQRSSDITRSAVSKISESQVTIKGLAESARKISDVISMITDIAEQTNLLALNATIEAARAGEAGRGFAVVAAEVKALASQTAKATDDITRQIADIQSATQNAVTGFEQVESIVTEINEISTSIAAAITEQMTATKEIAHSVVQASTGTTEVTSNIQSVSTAAGETQQAVGNVQQSADVISAQSSMLESEVTHFLEEVRKIA